MLDARELRSMRLSNAQAVIHAIMTGDDDEIERFTMSDLRRNIAAAHELTERCLVDQAEEAARSL